VGWIGGWSGGFLWVLILSCVLLFRGRTLQAGIGFGIFGLAEVLIVRLAPWRHPVSRYRNLMWPVYAMLALGIAWGAWSMGGTRHLGLSWWSLLLLMPILLPFWTAGSRRWSDVAADGALK
jgi:hypothetical protein